MLRLIYFQILTSLDDYHDEDAVIFMGVLHELTKAVERWFPHTKVQYDLHSVD